MSGCSAFSSRRIRSLIRRVLLEAALLWFGRGFVEPQFINNAKTLSSSALGCVALAPLLQSVFTPSPAPPGQWVCIGRLPVVRRLVCQSTGELSIRCLSQGGAISEIVAHRDRSAEPQYRWIDAHSLADIVHVASLRPLLQPLVACRNQQGNKQGDLGSPAAREGGSAS